LFSMMQVACSRAPAQATPNVETEPLALVKSAPIEDRGKSSSVAAVPGVEAIGTVRTQAQTEALEAEGYVDPGRCEKADVEAERILAEPGGPKQFFSVNGYVSRTLRIERQGPEGRQVHCVSVAWPQGSENNDAQPVQVAARVNTAWLGLLRNTLDRLPWTHVLLVRRIVIDNRPKEHGIAAFNRDRPDDARDGRTLWLHEHLFTAPNHWARGNYGSYWSYHLDQDGMTMDDALPDHNLFSPVVLHELGHLVMYWVENAHLQGPAASSNVPCARTCKDTGSCLSLSMVEREQGCISPYCVPFRFESSTENWAEQYRLYYQSSVSRSLLSEAGSACLPVLQKQQGTTPDPWQRGLPDMTSYRRSRWDSCGQRECRPW
jgi:hypothetical protein